MPLADGTWHYRLAAADYPVKDEEDEQWLAGHTSKPIGLYCPLPQARKFHRSTKRFRWALGGNRSSKSHALAMETIWRATGTHPYRQIKTPTTGWYATTTWPKLGELWRTKIKGLLSGTPYRVIWHNKQQEIPEVVLIPVEGGISRIECKAFEQGRESFQAAALNYIHFDEQFGQDIFIESITRIGAEQEADFAAAMTPIESQPWLEQRLVNERESHPDDAIFEFPLDDNRLSWGGFIPDHRIDALIEEWPIEVRETRRRGKWGAFLGAIFQSFSRELHVVSEERECKAFFLPQRAMPLAVGGLDWGGSNPFCFLWAARIPHLDNDWYVFDELYWSHREQGGRRLGDLAGDIKARTEKWKTRLIRSWADHDPTNALELAHNGVATMPAHKIGDADEISRAGIEQIQTLLKPRAHLISGDWPIGRPRLHVAARCKNLIREMGMYRWASVPDPEKKSARDIPLKVHDHAVDALRYLIHSEKPFEAGAMPDIGTYPRTFR